MRDFPKPIELVSRCLEVDKVRYNGQVIPSNVVHDVKVYAGASMAPIVEKGAGLLQKKLFPGFVLVSIS